MEENSIKKNISRNTGLKQQRSAEKEHRSPDSQSGARCWPAMALISSVDIHFIHVNDIYLLKAVTTESHIENPGCYFIISIVYIHTGQGCLSNRFNSAAEPWQSGYVLHVNTLKLFIQSLIILAVKKLTSHLFHGTAVLPTGSAFSCLSTYLLSINLCLFFFPSSSMNKQEIIYLQSMQCIHPQLNYFYLLRFLRKIWRYQKMQNHFNIKCAISYSYRSTRITIFFFPLPDKISFNGFLFLLFK